jgi:hypothetical protein
LPRNPKKNQFEIYFDPAEDISLTELSAKLTDIQQLVYSVATAISGTPISSTSHFPPEISGSLALRVVEVRQGSISITVEPTGQDQLTQATFDNFVPSLEIIEKGNQDDLERIFPERSSRLRALRSTQRVLPGDGNYLLSISGQTLRSTWEPFIRRQITSDESKQATMKTLEGELYESTVGAGRRKIKVMCGRRSITCEYSADHEDEVRNLVNGSKVRIEGIAVTDDTGRVQKIDNIKSISTIEVGILEFTSVQDENRKFTFSPSLAVELTYDGEIWQYENTHLDLLGYGTIREDALELFGASLGSHWDMIACEDDSRLTGEAIKLKKRLRASISSVEDLA